MKTRARIATASARLVNRLVRVARPGGGTVLGGRAGLFLYPGLLGHLALGRQVACVTGTNGKTTTTKLLAAALAAGPSGSNSQLVASNRTGANMPAGHVAALAEAPPDCPAVLEVDEGYLPRLLLAVKPQVVVCLNLSRDQLDRTNEVRMLSRRWRDAFGALGAASGTTVVANADDPLVAWAAYEAPKVVWVSAGMEWRHDSVGCPACGGHIAFDAGRSGGWACACGFVRPAVEVTMANIAGEVSARFPDGFERTVSLALPGRFNAANAVMAATAAGVLGIDPGTALEAMASVHEIGGRYSVREVGGIPTRLLLAKNPAGFFELMGLVSDGTAPIVIGINARVADGKDPSWLWDVPFERLAGRIVVATGERCRDLAVRLRYAGVASRTEEDPAAAILLAARLGSDPAGEGTRVPVDFVGNYTVFFEVIGNAVRAGSLSAQPEDAR